MIVSKIVKRWNGGIMLTSIIFVWSAIFGIFSPVSAAVGSDMLGPDEWLYADQSITSADGRFTLLMQSDGNLVLYQNGVAPLWSTNTVGSGADRVTMQSDGNLVVYTPGSGPVWQSSTVGERSTLIMQNDGNLVIYRESGGVAWHTNTSALPGPATGCVPGSNHVALFVAADYREICQFFGIGSYPDIRTTDLPNDSISSVRVGKDVVLELCSAINFDEVCEVFFGDDLNLTDNRIGNDRTSSLRVKALQRIFLPLLVR